MEPSKPFIIPKLTIVKPLKCESREGFVPGIHGDDLGDTVFCEGRRVGDLIIDDLVPVQNIKEETE
jgi:hypothetical protein